MSSGDAADRDEARAREDEVLRQWTRRVVDALDIIGLEVDIPAVLGLAGRAAHSVVRPAAPLTTFLVGYAAGLAAASGAVSSTSAVAAASDAALRLCRDEEAPASDR